MHPFIAHHGNNHLGLCDWKTLKTKKPHGRQAALALMQLDGLLFWRGSQALRPHFSMCLLIDFIVFAFVPSCVFWNEAVCCSSSVCLAEVMGMAYLTVLYCVTQSLYLVWSMHQDRVQVSMSCGRQLCPFMLYRLDPNFSQDRRRC